MVECEWSGVTGSLGFLVYSVARAGERNFLFFAERGPDFLSSFLIFNFPDLWLHKNNDKLLIQYYFSDFKKCLL